MISIKSSGDDNMMENYNYSIFDVSIIDSKAEYGFDHSLGFICTRRCGKELSVKVKQCALFILYITWTIAF